MTHLTSHRRIGAVGLMAAAALLLSGCAAHSTTASSASPAPVVSSATATRFQTALDDTRAAAGFPGAIAEVISPEGTWIGASGTSGPGSDARPTVADRTRIGSLTKTMTATVLLQLAQENKLSLADTIGQYVPDMPNGDSATLRQLADMTSGIPSYTSDPQWISQVFAEPEKQWSPQQLIAFVAGEPADFAPGMGWEYSNPNYVLLGLVIEKVTGEPIATVFQKRLFGPLGMTHTSFPINNNAIPNPYLRGVTSQGQGASKSVDATNFSPSIAFTAGQVISTLGNLDKWANALFTGDGILKPATEKLRRDSIIHDIPPNTATAGYGIGIGNRNGWWGHDGDIPGYTTSLFHNDELGVTIIVIVNSDVPYGSANTSPATGVFAALVAALQ